MLIQLLRGAQNLRSKKQILEHYRISENKHKNAVCHTLTRHNPHYYIHTQSYNNLIQTLLLCSRMGKGGRLFVDYVDIFIC